MNNDFSYKGNKYETLRGKVKWAKTHTPNKFGNWSVDVYPDEASLVRIQKLKEFPAVKNILKKDEDGQYMSFSRPTQKLVRGKMVMFERPLVLQRNPDDPEGEPTPLIDTLVGNGSDCDVLLEVYGWKGQPEKGIGPGRAARFKGLVVWNLVPFVSSKDYTVQERISVGELLAQPPMPQW